VRRVLRVCHWSRRRPGSARTQRSSSEPGAVDGTGSGWPCRSWFPLYWRIAGSALASARNCASSRVHGRSTIRPSDSTTSEGLPPAPFVVTRSSRDPLRHTLAPAVAPPLTHVKWSRTSNGRLRAPLAGDPAPAVCRNSPGVASLTAYDTPARSRPGPLTASRLRRCRPSVWVSVAVEGVDRLGSAVNRMGLTVSLLGARLLDYSGDLGRVTRTTMPLRV
jgi:hypothetical protein